MINTEPFKMLHPENAIILWIKTFSIWYISEWMQKYRVASEIILFKWSKWKYYVKN